MTVNLKDSYKQGVVDTVEEFEKNAVFSECMKNDSFREEFTKRITAKISEKNSLDSNLEVN